MGDLNASGTLPVVFMLTFGSDLQQSQFQSTHSGLLNMLFQKSILRHASTAQQALSLFGEHEQPQAVFVADPAIMLPRNEVVSQRLVQYASRGGVVVFGGLFGSHPGADKLSNFFGRTWDVPWRAVESGQRSLSTMSTYGSGEYSAIKTSDGFSVYTRVINFTPMALNLDAVGEGDLRGKLPDYYVSSDTAQFLQGVEHHDSWYVAESALSTLEPAGDDDDDDDDDETHAKTPSPPALTPMSPSWPRSDAVAQQTSIAFATFVEGRLGYVGDVDGEEETNAIVLAMMGLL